MIGLIQNEWMKIFKRPGTYVMIAILLIATTIFGVVLKFEQNDTNFEGTKNWEQNLKQENVALQRQMEGSRSPLEKQDFKKQITINSYRIKHHIPPETSYHLWDFVNSAAELIDVAGLFTIIISAGIVASEFTWGTIKLLLIRPIMRVKILLSKYLTILLYAIFLLVILFAYSSAIGAILFGTADHSSIYLNYNNGIVSEQSMFVHMLIYYGLNSINMIMLATMAFMISAVFRNSSLAVGLSIFLMFTGTQLTELLSLKFSWAKYILFANTDLMPYFEGTPLIEGMTLSFSVVVLFAYFLLFHFLAFYVFNKRDVAA
ncbi:ABC transporter permease [Neobacillus sp. PS3-12]|uniref:ABC transporter permease n=1 Tax=Neobacillus sp. PS3-12 TaxID=3070677 RepID=UPI0027E12A0C|nr:ABC transporter permease [Neobacillus sp. PS3-12]WML54158.1 ABC transporter permease [Neobacillus sp. PS3-12]